MDNKGMVTLNPVLRVKSDTPSARQIITGFQGGKLVKGKILPLPIIPSFSIAAEISALHLGRNTLHNLYLIAFFCKLNACHFCHLTVYAF